MAPVPSKFAAGQNISYQGRRGVNRGQDCGGGGVWLNTISAIAAAALQAAIASSSLAFSSRFLGGRASVSAAFGLAHCSMQTNNLKNF